MMKTKLFFRFFRGLVFRKGDICDINNFLERFKDNACFKEMMTKEISIFSQLVRKIERWNMIKCFMNYYTKNQSH